MQEDLKGQCEIIFDFLTDIAAFLQLDNLDELPQLLSTSVAKMFTQTMTAVLQQQKAVAFLFHDFLNHPLPKDEIDFLNPNCLSSVVWYKNILNIMFLLPEVQQVKLAEKYASHVSPGEILADQSVDQSVHFVFDQDEDFPSLDSISPISSPVALSDAHCHLDLINNRTPSPLSLAESLSADDGQSLHNVFTSYCFPSSSGEFHISSEIQNHTQVYICLGIHPKASS